MIRSASCLPDKERYLYWSGDSGISDSGKMDIAPAHSPPIRLRSMKSFLSEMPSCFEINFLTADSGSRLEKKDCTVSWGNPTACIGKEMDI
jgi:hypothetical protein